MAVMALILIYCLMPYFYMDLKLGCQFIQVMTKDNPMFEMMSIKNAGFYNSRCSTLKLRLDRDITVFHTLRPSLWVTMHTESMKLKQLYQMIKNPLNS